MREYISSRRSSLNLAGKVADMAIIRSDDLSSWCGS